MSNAPTLFDRMVARRPYPDDAQASFAATRGETDVLFNPSAPLLTPEIADLLFYHAPTVSMVTFTCTTTDDSACATMAESVRRALALLPPGKNLPFLDKGPTLVVRLYRYDEAPLPPDIRTFGEKLLHDYGITTDDAEPPLLN